MSSIKKIDDLLYEIIIFKSYDLYENYKMSLNFNIILIQKSGNIECFSHSTSLSEQYINDIKKYIKNIDYIIKKLGFDIESMGFNYLVFYSKDMDFSKGDPNTIRARLYKSFCDFLVKRKRFSETEIESFILDYLK